MFQATGWMLDEPQSKQNDENVVFAYVYPPEMKPNAASGSSTDSRQKER
jgi:hypothetical protein